MYLFNDFVLLAKCLDLYLVLSSKYAFCQHYPRNMGYWRSMMFMVMVVILNLSDAQADGEFYFLMPNIEIILQLTSKLSSGLTLRREKYYYKQPRLDSVLYLLHPAITEHFCTHFEGSNFANPYPYQQKRTCWNINWWLFLRVKQTDNKDVKVFFVPHNSA